VEGYQLTSIDIFYRPHLLDSDFARCDCHGVERFCVGEESRVTRDLAKDREEANIHLDLVIPRSADGADALWFVKT